VQPVEPAEPKRRAEVAKVVDTDRDRIEQEEVSVALK